MLAVTAQSSPATHRTPASAANVHQGPTRARAHLPWAMSRCCSPMNSHRCLACPSTPPSARAGSLTGRRRKHRRPPGSASQPAAHISPPTITAGPMKAPHCQSTAVRGPAPLFLRPLRRLHQLRVQRARFYIINYSMRAATGAFTSAALLNCSTGTSPRCQAFYGWHLSTRAPNPESITALTITVWSHL